MCVCGLNLAKGDAARKEARRANIITQRSIAFVSNSFLQKKTRTFFKTLFLREILQSGE